MSVMIYVITDKHGKVTRTSADEHKENTDENRFELYRNDKLVGSHPLDDIQWQMEEPRHPRTFPKIF